MRVSGLNVAPGQVTRQDLVLESLLPENGQYMVAAYIVTGCIYLAYAVSLMVRGRRERQ